MLFSIEKKFPEMRKISKSDQPFYIQWANDLYIYYLHPIEIQRLKKNKQTNKNVGSWEIPVVSKDCSVSTEIGGVNRKVAETELEN